ncbi:MAG: hypothetical protein Q9172_004935 [Xanthocarpia lactea]
MAIEKRRVESSVIAQYERTKVLRILQARPTPGNQTPRSSGSGTQSTSNTGRGEDMAALIWLLVVIGIIFLALLYCVYASHRSKGSWRRNWTKDNNSDENEDLELSNLRLPPDGYRRGHARDRSWSSPSQYSSMVSFGVRGFTAGRLSMRRRKKAAPPSLDLEALKPGKGRWWNGWGLPSIVRGRGNNFTPTSGGVDGPADGGRSGGSSSGYDIGAGARLLTDLAVGFSSAVASGGWSSGSLVGRSNERWNSSGSGGILPEDEVGMPVADVEKAPRKVLLEERMGGE